MKNCKSCENCNINLVYLYLRGIDYYECLKDGHHIEEPYFEKCENYKKLEDKPLSTSSWLFRLVEAVKKNLK